MPSPEPEPRETDIQAQRTASAITRSASMLTLPLSSMESDVPLFPRILPSLQPVANAISRTQERNLIDQSIGHGGYRLRLVADEESISSSELRPPRTQALCSVFSSCAPTRSCPQRLQRK